MPVVDVAALTAPVSDDAVCGPDLDAQGDPDFMNFMARAEGLLPASYFSGPDGVPFDRSQIDFPGEVAAAAPFLAQTRDVRLLVMLAKFAILSRSFADFVSCVQAIAHLLETRWDEVHPRAEGDDFTSRVAALETLDDSAPVILPLQYLPLVQSQRSGPITYRHVMFANGEVQAREDEQAPDRATIDKALAEAELDTLIAQRGNIEALRTALGAIETACSTRAGAGQAVKLAKATTLAANMFQLLNNAIALRDPAAALASVGDAGAPQPDGQPHAAGSRVIHSKADVAIALATVELYFCRSEPSNPALLLVRQARQLIGKSFLEAMQILVPGRVVDAKFRLGKDQLVEIPIESLASFSVVEDVPPADVSPEGTSADENDPQPSESGDAPPAETGGSLVAGTRTEAFGLLEQIAIYYRSAEPSSPIASLADRARGFADRDFLTLLKDLLPNPSSE